MFENTQINKNEQEALITLPPHLHPWIAMKKNSLFFLKEWSDSKQYWQEYKEGSDQAPSIEQIQNTIRVIINELKTIDGKVPLSILEAIITTTDSLFYYLEYEYKDKSAGDYWARHLDKLVYKILLPHTTEIWTANFRRSLEHACLRFLLEIKVGEVHDNMYKYKWSYPKEVTVGVSRVSLPPAYSYHHLDLYLHIRHLPKSIF